MMNQEDRKALLERCNELSSKIIEAAQQDVKDIEDSAKRAALIVGALHTAYHSIALFVYGKEQFLDILQKTIEITEEACINIEGEFKAEVSKQRNSV